MYWIDPEHPDASDHIAKYLSVWLHQYCSQNRPVIFVCIGTPAVIGDCLGPVTGTILSKYLQSNIYGTLEEPVHAVNIKAAIKKIKKQHQKPFIIAIDAALGNSSQTGYILLKEGPLHPGRGVGKRLPPIGHIQISGIFQDIFSAAAANQMTCFSRCISQGILKLYSAL